MSIKKFIKERVLLLGPEYKLEEKETYQEVKKKILENNKIRYIIMAVFIIAPFLMRMLFRVEISYWLSVTVSGMVIYTAIVGVIVRKNLFKTWKSLSVLYLAMFIVLDLLIAMPLIYHFMGGLLSSALVIATYWIIYGYLVFPRYVQAGVLSLFSFLSVVEIGLIDYFQVLGAPVQLFPNTIGLPQLNSNFLGYSLLVVFIVLYFTAYWSYMFARYLRDEKEGLRNTKVSLETVKASLEIKVRARTQALEEEKEHLDEKIKQRTSDLQEKMREVEKFNKLAVGRELKMIELKKEIDKLKEELKKQST